MGPLDVLQLTAKHAGDQVRLWRDGGLPRRPNDVLQLVEDLAFAAARAANSSQAELKLMASQIDDLRTRILALERRADDSHGTRRAGLVLADP